MNKSIIINKKTPADVSATTVEEVSSNPRPAAMSATTVTEARPSTPSVSSLPDPNKTGSPEKETKPKAKPKPFPLGIFTMAQLTEELVKLQLEDGKRQLSGAGKRRYAYHRNKGKGVAQAYNLALLPAVEAKANPHSSSSAKRARTNTVSPHQPVNHSKRPKPHPSGSGPEAKTGKAEARPPTAGTSYRDVVEGIRIGVIHSDHPNTQLSNDSMNLIQAKILAILPSAVKVGVNPQFRGISLRPGWMVINCLNEVTAAWLQKQSELISLDDASVKIVREEDIPRLNVITGYFYHSENDDEEQFLTYITVQNPGISTDNWKVLSRRVEDPCVAWTVSIDSQSLETLKTTNLRVSYKFGTALFRLRGKEPTSGEVTASSSNPCPED